MKVKLNNTFLYILCGTKDMERLFDEVNIKHHEKEFCIKLPCGSKKKVAYAIRKEMRIDIKGKVR